MDGRITAREARYIKLGPGGSWERLCLADGTLRLKYDTVPHELGLAGDLDRLRADFQSEGYGKSAATQHARQVLDFYTAPEDALWITFADGRLHWCFARPGVEFLGGSPSERAERGSRLRRAVDGWRSTSAGGRVLRAGELDGRLTQVAAYRQTICEVQAFDYLLRLLNDEESPALTRARDAQAEMLASIQDLMATLQPGEFELLVDLVFAQSGWRRTGAVGGPQKTVDLELELPSTGETAFAQVKSQANQATLDEYIAAFEARDEHRLFFVHHTAKGPLRSADERVTVIGPERLAEMILNAGLLDWLMKKAA